MPLIDWVWDDHIVYHDGKRCCRAIAHDAETYKEVHVFVELEVLPQEFRDALKPALH
jgi:hypothetical protein